ncbi:class I SAM-dependent methyltransferase [Motiliproteus sp. SC1-56]|uniref:class I SAM-dependent methyltransferase n=1 Tax=Motiliproteus sp. SC1-56 TaxID=2799565 RepID=UPI001A8EFE96|nr:class I SAM-dependent methyltransferase [Motiliproteus sp. SC1-56]
MADLFQHKAADWDARPLPQQISAGVGAALNRQLALTPELEVMDFGAGTGLVAVQLASKVRQIWAVDISPAMLEKLIAKPELAGKVTACCQDLLVAPLDRRFDLIVSAMALHHVEDTQALLKTFAAHLKPGAEIALADLDREDGSFHPAGTPGIFHHGFDRERLREALEALGFEGVAFTTAVTVSREGRDYPIFLVTARWPKNA